MFTLTHTAPHDIINLLPHCSTILAYRIEAAQTAIKRFFCAQNSSVSRYDRLSGAVARLAGASPVRQLHSDCLQMIGVILRWVYNLFREAIMNTSTQMGKSAQHPQTKTVSQFNIFLHRQLIAQGVSDSLALKIKSRYPATIVKFTGFAGGVL